jgi:allophanate hydrolase
VVLGPQREYFTEDAVARFLGETWSVGATSDRIGCRLAGERLEHAAAKEIVADGMVPGCVQIPPDGQPIVMLADCPSTGGYPKIATVVTADLGKLAQLLPGEGRVRFEPA